MRPADLVADLCDLVLGRACRDCGEPGRVLCDGCLAAYRGRAMRVPHPSGLTATAALGYDLGGPLVLDYKEHGLRSLRPMLGTLLADAVAGHLGLLGARAATVVPVPSHPLAVRGFDALGGLVRAAARDLAGRGLAVGVATGMIAAGAHRPLKGLGREERQREAASAFRPRAGRPPPLRPPVIVVDDVLTTGATTAAVRAALATLGIEVGGFAVVAATPGTPVPIPAPARPTGR